MSLLVGDAGPLGNHKQIKKEETIMIKRQVLLLLAITIIILSGGQAGAEQKFGVKA